MPAPDGLARRRDWRLGGGLLLVAVAGGSFLFSLLFVDWDAALAGLQQQRRDLQHWVDEYLATASAAFFLIYVLFTSLALPGAVLLTLVGGAVFPLWWGVILVSFASTAGATLSFLASRYLLRDRIQARYGQRLEAVNRELDRDGGLYLLALRLNPVVPFFLINLLFGLTRLPATRFWWVSQLGMLPATILYSNAGAQLASIESISSIVSGRVLLSLVALSLFPIVAKKLASWLRR